MMCSAKCHNCGTINDFKISLIGSNGIVEITFTCINCGALNEMCIDFSDPKNPVEDWLCLAPKGFEWSLPSGMITPAVGDPIYVSATGVHLSRKAYIDRYGVDPKIAYEHMRRERAYAVESTLSYDSSQLKQDQSRRSDQLISEDRTIQELRRISCRKAICCNCGTVNEVNVIK
jgi:hypothetical protein